jgi:uncharacterized membrane protein
MRVLNGRFRVRKVFLLAASLLALVVISLGAISTGPRYTSVTANPAISISTNDLRPGDVRFFTYRDRASNQIQFLLARDDTGRIKAAFDACQRCYTYHKGYASSEGYLICRFCGNRYKLQAMETGLASCVPVKLPFQMTGQAVTIRPADLEREREQF